MCNNPVSTKWMVNITNHKFSILLFCIETIRCTTGRAAVLKRRAYMPAGRTIKCSHIIEPMNISEYTKINSKGFSFEYTCNQYISFSDVSDILFYSREINFLIMKRFYSFKDWNKIFSITISLNYSFRTHCIGIFFSNLWNCI